MTRTTRWTPHAAHKWHRAQPWLVGCNFTPSTAINQLEMWQAGTFDPVTIDKELGGGQLFNTDPARAAQLGARHADIEAEWMRAMERWEVLGGS